MADNASAENVAADIRPPDFRGAVKKIRTVKAKKAKIAETNGDIADIWAKVEGLKVHKKAGKWFAILDELEPKERQDILRSMRGLIDAAGWEDDTDLVDRADGTNVVSLGGKPGGGGDEGGGDQGGGSGGGGEDDEDEGGQDASGEDDEQDPPPARNMQEALERSRARMGGGAPEAPATTH